MSYEKMGESSLDYFPCRYGESRLLFRGPRRKLEGDYVAVLGGTETYGKYVDVPFPKLVEKQLGMTVVNFGLLNAGVDAFLNDETVIEAAREARITVMQVTGAQNNSNRLYKVHPRRNDRFVRPSKLMQHMYRELDFTDFHFTRHLLQAVRKKTPDRYAFLCEELRQAWVARMTSLLQRIGGQIILLWFSDHAPDEDVGERDPLLISRQMIEDVRPLVQEIVEVVDQASIGSVSQSHGGFMTGELETLSVGRMMSAEAHQRAAERILTRLGPMLEKQRPA